MKDCPFCNAGDRFFVTSGTAAALWDAYPVNPGHALVVPLAHREHIFECTPEEISDIWKTILKVKEIIDRQHHPDGYNIGANVGRDSGQTIFHCHVHVIPRYAQDTSDPRGGIRRVKRAEVKW